MYVFTNIVFIRQVLINLDSSISIHYTINLQSRENVSYVFFTMRYLVIWLYLNAN